MERNRGMERKESVVENMWTPTQSTRGPRGYREGERKRKEGKVSRGYSLCYGVTIPRGCENADRTEMEGK